MKRLGLEKKKQRHWCWQCFVWMWSWLSNNSLCMWPCINQLCFCYSDLLNISVLEHWPVFCSFLLLHERFGLFCSPGLIYPSLSLHSRNLLFCDSIWKSSSYWGSAFHMNRVPKLKDERGTWSFSCIIILWSKVLHNLFKTKFDFRVFDWFISICNELHSDFSNTHIVCCIYHLQWEQIFSPSNLSHFLQINLYFTYIIKVLTQLLLNSSKVKLSLARVRPTWTRTFSWDQ